MPLYFAYGSCMSQADLKQSGIHARYVDTATLKHYRLAFSHFSLHRKGGVADIVRSKNDEVEGVLFDVQDFVALDRREGAPFVYQRQKVKVYPHHSTEWCWAWTYEVVQKSPVEFTPSLHYSMLIWDGAKILSPNYRLKLKKRLTFERIR